MVIGRRLSAPAVLPALRLHVTPSTSRNWKACDRACPMDVPISRLVQTGRADSSDCILRGECVDACPTQSVAFEWGKPRKGCDAPRPDVR